MVNECRLRCKRRGIRFKIDATHLKIFITILRRCSRLETCVVSVDSASLGDACPGTPKYLEVHYFCKEEEQSGPARQSPHFENTELTALWNQNTHKVDIETVLRAMQDRDVASEEGPAKEPRVPITTTATTLQEEKTGIHQSPQPERSSSGELDLVMGRGVNMSQPSAASSTQEQESASSAGSAINQSLLDEKKALLADHSSLKNKPAPLSEPREQLTPGHADWEATAAGGEPEHAHGSSDTVSSMFVLEAITYAVASICGIILVFLVFKVSSDIQCGPQNFMVIYERRSMSTEISFCSRCEEGHRWAQSAAAAAAHVAGAKSRRRQTLVTPTPALPVWPQGPMQFSKPRCRGRCPGTAAAAVAAAAHSITAWSWRLASRSPASALCQPTTWSRR